MAASPDSAAAPAWQELRSRLIPTGSEDRWDDGELPHAILHLDDHCALERCELDEAITNLPREYVRNRAWYLFWSAKAYAHNNDPEQAATVARDAVQILIDAGSDSVLEEARKLHVRLDQATSVPEVRELGDLLQTASNQ